MSDVAEFRGLGPSGGEEGFIGRQLRRIGSFHQGTAYQSAVMGNIHSMTDKHHGHAKEMASHESELRMQEAAQAHEHSLATITHTSREQRRSAAAAVKNQSALLGSLRSAGIDPSAGGVTRVKLGDMEVHTERPVAPAAARSRAKTSVEPTSDKP